MRLVLTGIVLTMLAASPARAAPRERVAVLSLVPTNVAVAIARATTQAFTDAVAEDPQLDVISQADIAHMLQFEQEKQMLGCSDSACLAELGGALGVRLLVTGTLAKLGSTYLVGAQLIDVARAKVLRRASREASDEGALLGAAKAVARDLGIAGPRPESARRLAIRFGAGPLLGVLGVGVEYRLGPIALAVGSGRYALAGGLSVPLPDGFYVDLHVVWIHQSVFGEVTGSGVGIGATAGYDFRPVPWLSVKGGLGLAYNEGAADRGPLVFDLSVGPVF